MSVDDTSSQDSALIDDDLVEALGFEPVTTLVSDDDEVAPAGANGHAVSDDVVSDDATAFDAAASDLDPVASNGDADAVVDLDASDDAAAVAAAGAMVAAVAGTTVDPEQALDGDEDLAGLIDDQLTVPHFDAAEEPDEDDLANKADELLDSHRDEISVLDDDDIELFDADDLDADDEEPARDAGVWADEDDSIVLLHDGGQTEAIEPIIDLSDDDPVDLTEAVPEAEVVDPYADYELGTPDSVFAVLPTSPPTITQPAVSPDGSQTTDTGRPRRTKRLRARKSRRVIRHIDPWSVLTFSVLFHMFVFAALLLGSVLVWNAAIASGMVENVESFIQELGDYETFEINADVMFKAAIVVAGMLTLASSVLVVLLTVVFNLISDLVGGIRVTVIEEETVRIPVKKKSPKSE